MAKLTVVSRPQSDWIYENFLSARLWRPARERLMTVRPALLEHQCVNTHTDTVKVMLVTDRQHEWGENGQVLTIYLTLSNYFNLTWNALVLRQYQS